jgi:antibiotic biosynthesis monooxygenase (ABM) superfamily enzyme
MVSWQNSARWQFSLATLLMTVTVVGIGCALGPSMIGLLTLLALVVLLASIFSIVFGVLFFAVLYALNFAVWLLDRAGDRFQ